MEAILDGEILWPDLELVDAGNRERTYGSSFKRLLIGLTSKRREFPFLGLEWECERVECQGIGRKRETVRCLERGKRALNQGSVRESDPGLRNCAFGSVEPGLGFRSACKSAESRSAGARGL